MKKILNLIVVSAIALLMLTSCGTTVVAAETSSVAAEIEYYDYDMGYVVVYIDGIPNYRFWDDMYRRYYFRPVPNYRYSYIRTRPVPHHRHGPAHRPAPGHRPHHQGTIHHQPRGHRPAQHAQPNHNNRRPSVGGGGTHHAQPSRGQGHPSSTRATGGSHSGGHFGGRR